MPIIFARFLVIPISVVVFSRLFLRVLVFLFLLFCSSCLSFLYPVSDFPFCARLRFSYPCPVSHFPICVTCDVSRALLSWSFILFLRTASSAARAQFLGSRKLCSQSLVKSRTIQSILNGCLYLKFIHRIESCSPREKFPWSCASSKFQWVRGGGVQPVTVYGHLLKPPRTIIHYVFENRVESNVSDRRKFWFVVQHTSSEPLQSYFACLHRDATMTSLVMYPSRKWNYHEIYPTHRKKA